MIRAFSILFLLIITHKSNACSCNYEKTLMEELKSRDLVVKATILSIDTLIYTDTIKFREIKTLKDYSTIYVINYLIKVLVLKKFKGEIIADTIPIITGLGGGDCGFPFEIGKEYLIYANKRNYSKISKDSIKAQKNKEYKIPTTHLIAYETNICTWTIMYNKLQEEDLINHLKN